MYTIVGALVWLFIGIPVAGFALYILTAPFRAARRAAEARRRLRAGMVPVWDAASARYVQRPRDDVK